MSLQLLSKMIRIPMIQRSWISRKIYNRFCLTSDKAELQAYVAQSNANGIRVMLDYAVEHSENAQKLQAYSTLCVTLDALRRANANANANANDANMLAVKLSAIDPQRLDSLCRRALNNGVSITIDAEQSTIQPDIHRRVIALQKHYHLLDPSFRIYNTYQCYLKSSFAQLSTDLNAFRSTDIPFACKLVRGAYLTEELGNKSGATFVRKADTDLNYRRCMDLILAGPAGHTGPADVILATHNSEDIAYARARAVGPAGGFQFAMLKGMKTDVIASLARDGERVYEYVPFGPIDRVAPYLVRRLQELSKTASMGDVAHQCNGNDREKEIEADEQARVRQQLF